MLSPVTVGPLVLALATVSQAIPQIISGATWTAMNTGHHIQAHAPGIIEVSGVYYMVGEDKTGGSSFQNINCYSSKNLVEWTFENAVLSRTSDGDLGPNRIVERPKVIYNDKTSTYVMYLHIDDTNYAEAKVGVATSKTVCGKYEYHGSFRPLGYESRDIGLFKDDDGSAYLLTEDRPNGIRIDVLTEDYRNVSKTVYLWPKGNEVGKESPAILKKNGYYFMFASWQTGWNTNNNIYRYARSLSGPWSEWDYFADGGSNTYNSQTSFILPFGDSGIYMGDRWQPSDLPRSTYVWLPLEITGTKVSMKNRVSWAPDVQSQKWTDAPVQNSIEGEKATLSNGAKSVSCSGCSQRTAAGWIGGPSSGTVTFSGLKSKSNTRTTIRVAHVNGDKSERDATVTVNWKSQHIAFLPTGDGATTGYSSITCDLVAGSDNTLVIAGVSGGYGPDVDYIAVPFE